MLKLFKKNSVIDEFLAAAGRSKIKNDSFIEWAVHETRRQRGIPEKLILKSVDSPDAKVSIVTLDKVDYIVWDAGYERMLDDLLGVIVLDNAVSARQKTESIIIDQLATLLEQRGKEKLSNQLKNNYVRQDWEHQTPYESATIRYFKLEAVEAETESKIREIEEFVKRARHTIPPLLNMLKHTIVYYTIAHEIGHWVFSRSPSAFDYYKNYVRVILDKIPPNEDEMEAMLPDGLHLKEDENGNFLPDTTGDFEEKMALHFREKFKQDVLSKLGPLEELCCDIFAIDAVVATIVSRERPPLLQLAEIELALWINNRYIKWLSYLRFDILSHLGLSAKKTEDDMFEKHMRNAIKGTYMDAVISAQPDEDEKKIRDHGDALFWLKLLFQDRQKRVFHRLSHHPEFIRESFKG